MYTASSGYQWLIHVRRAQETLVDPTTALHAWNWIWRIKEPFKIIFLIWLGSHSALPVNHLRHSRGMAASPMCTRCNLYPETVLHCLRDCWFARRVWHRLGFITQRAAFNSLEARDWFKFMVNEDEALALSAIWFIWTARNRALFDHAILPEERLLQVIREHKELLLHAWPSQPRTAQPRLVSWVPPEEDEVAVNCDGSSLGNPVRSGFGGCIRDSHGSWIHGFLGFGQQNSVLHMELMAIFKWLELVWTLGYRHVVCFSDSMLAINLVRDPPSQYHVFAVLIAHICQLLKRSWRVRLEHILREGNFCADFVAKAGANQEVSFLLLPDPLPGIGDLLIADSMGSVVLRQ